MATGAKRMAMMTVCNNSNVIVLVMRGNIGGGRRIWSSFLAAAALSFGTLISSALLPMTHMGVWTTGCGVSTAVEVNASVGVRCDTLHW